MGGRLIICVPATTLKFHHQRLDIVEPNLERTCNKLQLRAQPLVPYATVPNHSLSQLILMTLAMEDWQQLPTLIKMGELREDSVWISSKLHATINSSSQVVMLTYLISY